MQLGELSTLARRSAASRRLQASWIGVTALAGLDGGEAPEPRRRADLGAPRPTVLLVVDDSEAATERTDTLERVGYRVTRARSGAEAHTLAASAPVDLIAVDLKLADVDPLILGAHLKALADVPVIIWASRAPSRRSDPILALKLGLDDFIVGLDPYELEVRLEAALRRAARAPTAGPPTPSTVRRIGELAIDHTRHSVTLAGHPVYLTPSEYRILLALASCPDEVVTREELAEHLWGQRGPSSSGALDVHMRRLRVKLSGGPVPPPPITTIRGFGYKLGSQEMSQPAN